MMTVCVWNVTTTSIAAIFGSLLLTDAVLLIARNRCLDTIIASRGGEEVLVRWWNGICSGSRHVGEV